MTIEEYTTWKATRGDDASLWTREDCIAADRLVRDETIKRLDTLLRGTSRTITDYVRLMVRCHFGSVETDNLLASLGAYPEWI